MFALAVLSYLFKNWFYLGRALELPQHFFPAPRGGSCIAGNIRSIIEDILHNILKQELEYNLMNSYSSLKDQVPIH